MKRILTLTESKLINLIKQIIKEQEIEEIRFTPEQYLQLLKNVAYQAHLIPQMKRFKDKKIVITGKLDLTQFKDQKMLTDLGSIKIDGDLNVSNTNIKNLDNVKVSGSMRYWGTPYYDVIQNRIRQAKYREQEERRENGEWDLENTNDDEAVRATAAFLYAMQRGDVSGLTDDDRERIKEIDEEIQRLEEEQENLDAGEEDYSEKFDEIIDKQSELEEEKDELISGKFDVYDFYPDGTHYKMDTFECLSTGYRYAVGTESEGDESMEDYYEEWVENPQHYINKDQLSYFIDGDAVANDWEDTVRDWVYDEPDSYGVEKQLSRDQEEEIWVLEMEKYIFENTGVRFPILYPTKKDGAFDFMDEEDNHFQYKKDGDNWFLYKDGVRVDPNQIYEDEDTKDHQDDRESRISDIEYEIQEIKDNPDGGPSDDDVEEAVEDYLENIRRRPADWLEEMSFDSGQLFNYIDKDKLKDDLISDSDYGNALNGYDGNYDWIKVSNKNFIVMRID